MAPEKMKKPTRIRQKLQLETTNKKGIIYIGHLPKRFEENELVGYFKQFGDVRRVKVSRSKKTGQPKGYGYIQFKNEEVADIAAETMNNYIMFRKCLQVHVVKPAKVHDELFTNCDQLFVPSKARQRAIARFNTPSKKPGHLKKRLQRRKRMLKKLQHSGYEIEGVGTELVDEVSEGSTEGDKHAVQIKVAGTDPVDVASKVDTKSDKHAVQTKSVQMADTPLIIRDSVCGNSDDEISFKTPAEDLKQAVKVTSKQKSTSKKVFPKTPIPNKKSKMSSHTPETTEKIPASLNTSAQSVEKFALSDASPALPARVKKLTKTPVHTPKAASKGSSPKTTPKTPPKKTPKFSPRVTRSVAKKRKAAV